MIVIMSLWCNDEDRGIHERVRALLSKTCLDHEVALLWAVGDSSDNTEAILRQYEQLSGRMIRVVNVDTGVQGEDAPTRRVRLSQSATLMFAALERYFGDSDYSCLHESDLISPANVMDLLLIGGNGHPCAGWPVINLTGTPQFYDIWAYRHRDGRFFVAEEHQPVLPFRVHGFGSVWVAPTWLVSNRVMKAYAIRELCAQWRDEGHPMYCDPRVIIEQPVELWTLTCLT